MLVEAIFLQKDLSELGNFVVDVLLYILKNIAFISTVTIV